MPITQEERTDMQDSCLVLAKAWLEYSPSNYIQALKRSASQLEKLNPNIDELTKKIDEASQSSDRLSKALNRITVWGVGVAIVAVLFEIFKYFNQ